MRVIFLYGSLQFKFVFCLLLTVSSEVVTKLKSSGILAELCHGKHLPKLIRNVEKQKVPLMAVVGPKEVAPQTVTIKARFGGELGTMTVDDLICKLQLAIESKPPL